MKENLKKLISFARWKELSLSGTGQEEGHEEEQSPISEDVMIECDNLVKIYKTKDIEVLALQGLDLTVKRGELTAIIGNSGSGKSTFLNMIGGLDRPSAGKLYVDGKNLFRLSEKELVDYKRDTVGFVWQNNARNLLPYLTAWENVMMPMLFSPGMKPLSTAEEAEAAYTLKDRDEEKEERAIELLRLVDMEKRKNHRLSQLSGGEQQRVAIAIALANNPRLLLADEPTGSVDRKTADYILNLFHRLNEEMGLTILIVTHDNQLASKVNRVVSICDGKTSSERIMKYREKLKDMSVQWNIEDTQEEFAVLDRAGRVQIPSELLDKIGIQGNKIKLEVKDGKILVENPDKV